MEIRIEKYGTHDKNVVIEGLVALQNAEVPLSDTRVQGNAEGAEQYLETLLSRVSEGNGAFFCAHINEELVGFAVCWVENDPTPNETADSTTYGYISDAFVFEQYRGQGVFKALHAAAEKHFAQLPEVKRIRINVLANNVQALAAYRSAGYADYEITLEKKVALEV